MKFHFGIILLLLALSSCEGNTTRQWTVRNYSSQDISMETLIDGQSKSFQIEIGDEEIILLDDKRGGQKDPGNAMSRLDSILIFNTQDTAHSNFEDANRWSIKSDHRNKVPSDYFHEFILEITDSDFE